MVLSPNKLNCSNDATTVDLFSSTLTGGLNIGQKTVTITDTYEMVGNPYAATIDVNEVYANSGNGSSIKRNFCQPWPIFYNIGLP